MMMLLMIMVVGKMNVWESLTEGSQEEFLFDS